MGYLFSVLEATASMLREMGAPAREADAIAAQVGSFNLVCSNDSISCSLNSALQLCLCDGVTICRERAVCCITIEQ